MFWAGKQGNYHENQSTFIDRFAIQSWTLWPNVHKTIFPLHKLSENPLVCYYPRQSTACDLTVVQHDFNMLGIDSKVLRTGKRKKNPKNLDETHLSAKFQAQI